MRKQAFQTMSRLMGRQLLSLEKKELDRYVQIVRQPIKDILLGKKYRGDAREIWMFVEKAISNAVINQAHCATFKAAMAYVKSVIERCIIDRTFPGEFKRVNIPPKKSQKTRAEGLELMRIALRK